MTQKSRPGPASRRHGSVLLLLGGTFQSIAARPEATGADVVVYGDVANEIEAAGARGAATLTLASGQTIPSLLGEEGPAELRDLLERRPGVNLNIGLAQLRGLGGLAARRLLEDPSFERFVHAHVLDELLIRHNGELDTIEVIVWTSNAGGTGGPAARLLAQAVAHVLLDHTAAHVHVHLLRAGSLSYTGLGDRVHRNAAATLAEDLRYVVAAPRHEREMRSLMLCELPMLGARKQQRDAFVLQLAQALCARLVREASLRCLPNDALSSALGTVSLLQISWWKALEAQRVAGEVAGHYSERLEEALRTRPRAGWLTGIKVQTRAGTSGPGLEELTQTLRRSGGVEPADLLEHCRGRARVEETAIHAETADGRALRLTGPDGQHLSAPARTTEELVRKLSCLRALEGELRRLGDEQGARLLRHRRARDQARQELEAVLRRLYPATWWDWALSLVASPTATLVRFKNAVTRYRGAQETLTRLEAEEAATRALREKTAGEVRSETRRAEALRDRLREVLARSGTAGGKSLVEVADLDERLEMLLREADGCDADRLIQLLGECVHRVTLRGLAEIAGAAEAEVGAVAARLEGAEPDTTAPPWGGGRRAGGRDIYLVLPPLSQTLEGEVRGRLGSDTQVACAATARGGVNVVRLEVTKPRFRDEVFPPFLLRSLEKAAQEKGLYFVGDFDLEGFLSWLDDILEPGSRATILERALAAAGVTNGRPVRPEN